MQTLEFSNIRGTININQSAPYFLQRVEGISSLAVDVISQKSPGQNGATYLNSYVNTRNVTITIALNAENETALNDLKRTLSRLFNPNLKSKLKYSNGTYTYDIDVVVEKTPDFIQTNRNPNYQFCFISLIAHNPYWKDLEFTEEVLSISAGGFEFDLELGDTFEFETGGLTTIVVDNIGDVPTPIEVTFNGRASIAKLTNNTTGEYISVNKQIQNGEQIIVNTEKGNKSVIFDNGVVTANAFSYIDLDSTFFELVPGENTLTYSSGFMQGNPVITIKYKNMYLGV